MSTVATDAPAPRWKRWLQVPFLLAALIAAAALFAQQGDAIAAALARLDSAAILWTLVAAGGHVVFSYWTWRALAPHRDGRLSVTEARRLFFLSQAGKYVPGGIWQFVAAAEIGHGHGIARRDTMASFVFALLAAIAAGATLALLVLAGQWTGSGLQWWWFAIALLPVAALLLPPVARTLARLARLERAPTPGRLLAASMFAIGMWCMAGVMLAALARGLGVDPSLAMTVSFSAFYAAAWIAGFFVLIAPAGIGAREGVLIALLSTTMPVAEATILALLARVAVTVVDLGAAGLVLALSRRPASQ